MYQLAISIILFVILIVAAVLVYKNYYQPEQVDMPRPATKEEIEVIYGATIDISDSDKKTLESIYGN